MKKALLLTALTAMALITSACTPTPPSEVTIKLHEITETLEIHTDEQKAYVESENPDTYINVHDMELSTFSKSAPKMHKFTWDITTDNGTMPSYSYVIVDDGVDTYKYETYSNECEVHSLKLNTEYTWKVETHFGNGGSTVFTSETSTFKTTGDAPRNIFVEGMENVRDLGGWNIGEGKLFKQGLIYRSAELNGNENGLSKPTDAGKKMLLENLHIKSDIDVRKENEIYGITSSPIGSEVTYKHFPMVFEHSNVLTNPDNTESLKAFFEYLSHEDSYPVMFHCVRGTDRTGALAYAIEAMCGVSKEDMMKDYLFSNFANINSSVIRESDIDYSSYYPAGIANSEGATLSEKAKNYINTKVGVSLETLDKIVDILTD